MLADQFIEARRELLARYKKASKKFLVEQTARYAVGVCEHPRSNITLADLAEVSKYLDLLGSFKDGAFD